MAIIVRDLFVNSTNVFQLQLFYSAADIAALPYLADEDKYITTAEVSVTLKDLDGETILEALPLAYVNSSDGIYRGEAPPNPSITLGTDYEWIVTVSVGGRAQELSGVVRATRNDGRAAA